MSDKPEVTRIAPSPSGFMHIGTARTALFNWLVARASGGKFILRMDDTDTSRNITEAEQPILDGLQWLGLSWDQFHRQSLCYDRYRELAEGLVEARLARRLDNGAVELSVPELIPTSWEDSVVGTVRLSSGASYEQLRNGCILMRGAKEGERAEMLGPTYNFASIIDDIDLGITHVIRGKDHIDNTIKQLYIKMALERAGLTTTWVLRFSHVGLIFSGGKKMSKRDGAASLLDYRDKGFTPIAIINQLLRTGWGPRIDNKANSWCPTIESAVELFRSGGRFRASEANFDAAKLDAYQRKSSAGPHC
jgi:glutamyl-tRNA synthetase